MTEESKPPLLRMPLEIMNIITKDFKLKDVLKLRKICHQLRHYSDTTQFELKIQLLQVSDWKCFSTPIPDFISFWITTFDPVKSSKIEYQKTEDGCTVTRREGHEPCCLKLLKNEDFATVAGNDLGVILRNVKSISGSLSIHAIKESVPSGVPAFERLLSSLEDQLKFSKSLYPLGCILLHKHMEQKSIMKVLSFLDSSALNHIQLVEEKEKTPEFCRMDDLVESEYWKRAKWLTMERSCDQPLKDFHHFVSARFFIKQLSSQELFELKEVRLQNPTLWRRRFEFEYQKMTGKKKLNALMRGPPFVEGRTPANPYGLSTWLFPIPDSERVLELKMTNKTVELMIIDKK